MTLYLDSSALVKLVQREDESSALRRFLRAGRDARRATSALARVDRTVGIVAGTLVTLFLLLFAVVNVVVRRIVLKPIALLATAAESISTGQRVDVNLNVRGGDEISMLCRAFDRMRTSVEKSIAMLTARE